MWTTKEPGVIAVGVDGSPESLAAARFAIEEAGLRGLQVQLLHSYQVPTVDAMFAAEITERFRDRGEQLLRQMKAQLDIPRTLHLETVLRQTSAENLLDDAAAGAEMVVLGRHHRDKGGRLTLRGPASLLAPTAPCPVVTVAAGQPQGGLRSRPVVVALDAETTADPALDFALEEAVLRRTRLVALHAEAPGHWPIDVEASRATVTDLVQRRNHALPSALVLTLILPGDPDDVIIDASRDAAILVVGCPHRRQLGAWTSTVGQTVLSRANCPLVIVPHLHRSNVAGASDLLGQPAAPVG